MTPQDTSHLVALMQGLSNERKRFNAARNPQERELRAVWVRQLEKEVADEERFLGFAQIEMPEMTDEDLMAELMA